MATVDSEPLLQLIDLLPVATLLVTTAGEVVAANRAVADRLGLDPAALRGRPLAEVAREPAAAVARFLRDCARSRQILPGALTVAADGRAVSCRAEGAVLRPRAGDEPAVLLLRLIPREEATDRFRLLNRRIDDLT